MLAVCRELGITFVAYSPLGRRFLTGQIKRFEDLPQDDFRRHSPRFQGDNFSKNLELVHHVEEIARKKRITPGQLALAWVLAQGDEIIPIPGTKRVKFLEENVAAADVELSSQEVKELAVAFPEAAGARYPEQGMRYVNG